MLRIPILIIASHIIFASASGAGKGAPLKITAEITAENKAVIKLTGTIREWSSANSTDLDVKITELISQGYKDAIVYINTKGGETMEAAEIFNVLRKMPGTLTAEAGSIIASAGTYIACKCDKFGVHSNTQYMWHKPQGIFEGTHDEIESGLKLLKNTENDYLGVYSAKTKKTTEELAKLWDKGDQWLMGKEIVDEGFADYVIDEPVPVSEADVEVLNEIGAPVIPTATAKKTTPNTNPNTREMKINPITIGLAADATEAQIEARLKELNDKAAKTDALEQEKVTAAANAKKDRIKAILDKAQTDKKITTETRADYETILNANLEAGEKVINSLPVLTALSAELTDTSTGGVKGISAERIAWTFADWQQKDPKGLKQLEANNIKEFDKLFDAQHKKD